MIRWYLARFTRQEARKRSAHERVRWPPRQATMPDLAGLPGADMIRQREGEKAMLARFTPQPRSPAATLSPARALDRQARQSFS